MEKSVEFYKKVFSAKLLVKGKRLAYFDLCGIWIALNLEENIQRNEIHKSYTHIAFSIKENEYDGILIKLKEMDVDVQKGRIRDKEEGRSIYFQDPDGHKFEFHTKTREERIEYYQRSGKRIGFF